MYVLLRQYGSLRVDCKGYGVIAKNKTAVSLLHGVELGIIATAPIDTPLIPRTRNT